ncbi:efflux RND transporter periplasmic adaptor subunit [Sphingosinithalassobacter sp. CS137]|uniref:efflux RND transporter periplasmic adaptor subunit n=1 Tax=Sphingosinithalassobacter sp. CS137 TaxID=2762748 RepID=UPI00165EB178|nr:efflux RND transporter periplasmic adaptor subunit [Sphingosinithalassobacter sp. CS137]
MTRKSYVIIAGAVLLALVAWLFLRPEASQAPQPEEQEESAEAPEGVVLLSNDQIRDAGIAVERAMRGAALELVFPATVAAAPTSVARIDARAAGVVRTVEKTLGDYVRRGEAVARIESGEAAALAAQLSAARARVTELSAAYERERQLFDANVTARQELEAARANLSVAQSELERAQAAAAAAGVSADGRSIAVTSPLAGRVTAAPIVLGSYVNAGDELYSVVNPSGLQIEVAVPAADAGSIAPGDEAIITLPGGGEANAEVRSITPSLDPESRSAVAILSLPRPLPNLQPGAFVQVRIRPSGEVDVNQIAVPEAAVQVLDDNDVVFVRTQRGFQAQPVEIGTRSGGRVTILSGLEAGQTIATTNAFLLKAEIEKEEAEHGH